MQKASDVLRPSTGPVVRQIRSRENSIGGTKHPLECARAESTVVRVRLQLWRGGKKNTRTAEAGEGEKKRLPIQIWE